MVSLAIIFLGLLFSFLWRGLLPIPFPPDLDLVSLVFLLDVILFVLVFFGLWIVMTS